MAPSERGGAGGGLPAMAHSRGEAPRMGMKRKFSEEPRNRDGRNAGVPPEAPVSASCSCPVRHVRTDTTTQPLDVVNCSLEEFQRARMEAAGKEQLFPVVHTNVDDNCKWGYVKSAVNTLGPSPHREHDFVPFNHGGVSSIVKPPRETVDAPNVKRGKTQKRQPQVAWQEIQIQNQHQKTRQRVTTNDHEEHRDDIASAGGATAGGVVDYGFKLQFDDKGVMSLNLTGEFVRGVLQGLETSIDMKVESTESGGRKSLLLTWNGIRDYV